MQVVESVPDYEFRSTREHTPCAAAGKPKEEDEDEAALLPKRKVGVAE